MKAGKYTLPSILGASVLAGGLYLTYDAELKQEGTRVLVDTVIHRTENTISLSGDTKTYSNILHNTSSSHPQIKDPIDDLLKNNPTLKQRIQGMMWHQDYLTGNLDKATYIKYLFDAVEIEDLLEKNHDLFDKIQYEPWWHRYLNGETNPSDMLIGNMQAYFDVLEIERKNPEIYIKASASQHWNSGTQYGEDYIVVGQRELLQSLSLRLTFLDEHPEIEKKLQERGFTRDNLFTDDWSKGYGIYEILYSMQDESN